MERLITFFGSGKGTPGDPAYDQMKKLGSIVNARGGIPVTGGFGGSGMEAPARGAHENGGQTIIGHVLRDTGLKANQYLTEVVDHSVGPEGSPLPVETAFCLRLAGLTASQGFVFGAGAGIGTFVELMTIFNHNLKLWKSQPRPVALLGEAWYERLQFFSDQGLLGPGGYKSLSWLCVADTPEQAANHVLPLMD
ncbi:LOG family protein [Patescibacteria group bacterium]|nr:LOG family protein [Patescibacteria group bacterium]MBU1890041.1 LOG family protein [Patescibacteria group bacterium]